jgi:hypothetical protein
MSEMETFPNGAAVMADRDARGQLRFAIFDAAGGDPVRYMRDYDAAVAFAMSLPVPELEPLIPLHRLDVAPRARERGVGAGMDVYVDVPEPDDGAPSRAMSPARTRSGIGPSERPVPAVAPRPRRET